MNSANGGRALNCDRIARYWKVGAAAAFGFPVCAAFAENIEEVVVTAQKREQSIQDVGISISAFSGAQLDRLGLDDSVALSTLVPGVSMGGSNGGQTMYFTVRGVAQNDPSDHTESPVAVYMDDTYVVLAQAQKFTLFDLERVEVLRGPQGTLFGRNATGGLVHFISRRPTRELDGFVELQYGAYDSTRVEAAMGGPISESLAGRISAVWSRNDAYLRNDYDPSRPEAGVPSQALLAAGAGADLGREANGAIRAQLSLDVSDQMNVWLGFNWAESRSSTPPYQSEPTAVLVDAQGRTRDEVRQPSQSTAQAFSYETGQPIMAGIFGPFPRPVPGGDATGYIDPDGRALGHTAQDFAFDDLNRFETWGAAAKLSWDFGSSELTAISDYKTFDKRLGLDLDAAPMNMVNGFHIADVQQWSQEVRLSGKTQRARWIAGLYYLHAQYDYRYGFHLLDNGLLSGDFPADYPAYVDQSTDNGSLFGEIEYDLTGTLALTAGLRIMREQKDYDYVLEVRAPAGDPRDEFNGPLIGVFSDVVGLPVPTQTSQKSDANLWTGRLQLGWKARPDMLVYAGVNRGVKAGGFNAPVDLGATQLRPGYRYGYDEEVLTAYEAGWKSTWLDGRMRLNGSFYFYDYSGYQGFTFRGISTNIDNYEAEYFGGEIELLAAPFAGLDIILSAAAVEAKVQDVEVAEGILSDVEPPYTPPWKLNALVRYAWQAFGGELAAQVDATYVDAAYYSMRNFQSHRLDAYWLTNARLSWESADRAWELSAGLNNAGDKVYATHGFGISELCGCSEIGVAKPRWWSVQLRRQF